MSREVYKYEQIVVDKNGSLIENPIQFHFGSDHALGKFIDITDRRWAKSGKDEQGEGYVLEWSTLFGISTNLIGATLEDVEASVDRLAELTEEFINKNVQ